MSLNPKVSVVIPAYNPGPYLDLAIQSVLAQTLTEWEVIVVDDGSAEDLSRIGQEYPQVKLMRQSNRGASVARNAGILASSGEFIAFLDADDLWEPTKLERQVALMNANLDAGLCHTSFQIINADGEVTGPGFQGYDKDYKELLTGCGICASTVLVRRECLAASGLFDPFCPPVEDYDLWLKIARDYELCRVQSNLAFYRIHGRNISGNYVKMLQMQTSILNRHAALAKSANDHAAFQAARAGKQRARTLYGVQAYDHARSALRERRLKSFVGHLFFALTYAPNYTASSLLFREKKTSQKESIAT